MRRLIALALLLVATGCAGTARQPLDVTLADVRFRDAGLLAQRVGLVLLLHNPNDAAVGVDGLNADLEVNGRPFARASTGERLTVPRLGERTVVADGSVSTLALLRQILDAPDTGAFSYRLTGTVYTGGGFGASTASPFESGGRLDLPGLQR